MIKMNKVIPEERGGLMSEDKKKVKIYPTFEVDNEDLPELEECEVGEKYTVVLEVETLGLRKGKDWQGQDEKESKMTRATFKILKIGLKEQEEEKEDDYETEYANKRSNSNK